MIVSLIGLLYVFLALLVIGGALLGFYFLLALIPPLAYLEGRRIIRRRKRLTRRPDATSRSFG